jgi:CRISPR system Cascade subunit CasB
VSIEAFPPDALAQRRHVFVTYLYGLCAGLDSTNPRRAAESRQVLARLRRSFAGPRQEAEAYDVVFAHDPPQAEQEVWLLVAGLFALHPLRRPSGPQRSLGAAMSVLAQRRGESANRRFVQLVSVDRHSLPHYLRQAVQLLRTESVPLDYEKLLTDLVRFLSDNSRDDDAYRVRLNWARDFHIRPRPERPGDTGDASTSTGDSGEERDH